MNTFPEEFINPQSAIPFLSWSPDKPNQGAEVKTVSLRFLVSGEPVALAAHGAEPALARAALERLEQRAAGHLPDHHAHAPVPEHGAPVQTRFSLFHSAER